MLTVQSQTMKRGMPTDDGGRRSIGQYRRVFGSLRASKNARELAYSLVGSPDYMAVEMLRGEGYSQSVDYWALACILFEMCIGFTPFADDDIEAVFRNIFSHATTLNFPDINTYLSADCWDLISAILKEPAERLGRNGISEIKAHRFFAPINWRELETARPPWVPELSSDVDTRYFDEYVASEGTLGAVDDDSGADPSSRRMFSAFTFKRGSVAGPSGEP